MQMPKVKQYKIKARRFYLFRIEDETGVSGTGPVAEGIEFESGMCALAFTSPYNHVNIYSNLHALEQVHSHGDKTKVIFEDQ